MNVAMFSALAEPKRIRIIEVLRDRGALTVGEIAQRLGLRSPQSSKHISVLVDAGLVHMQAVANRRICTLRTESFVEMESWMKTFISMKEEQYDRFDEYLSKIQKSKQ